VPVRAVVEDVTMRLPFMPYSKCVAFVVGGAPLSHEARMVVRARDGEGAAVSDRVRAALADGPGRDASVFVEVGPLASSRGLHHRLGRRLSQLLSTYGAFMGMIALLGALAATSFLVAQRRRELGIRRALGGTQADIVGAFLIENVLVLVLGSLVGLAGAALLFVIMQPVLLGLSVDRVQMAWGLGLFWMATLAATLVPALRAARVPPSVASRSL
jgi:putative ABC transport system permease protein